MKKAPLAFSSSSSLVKVCSSDYPILMEEVGVAFGGQVM